MVHKRKKKKRKKPIRRRRAGVTRWDVWLRIEPAVNTYCRKKCNDAGKDYAQELLSRTKLLFIEKWVARNFVYKDDASSQKYAIAIARRLARDVLDYHKAKREVSLDEISGIGATVQRGIDERITMIYSAATKKVRDVIFNVIIGEDIVDACKLAKIRYAAFIEAVREA
ncbi:MAG: hypothetical protein ACLPX5_13210 [Dissulfurispiraceae bacterium]